MQTTIEPLGRQASLGEQAYDRLKESILGGQFEPGVKFTVRSIAELLQVSTTPARDAINRLVSEGALVNRGPKTIILPDLTQEDLNEITKIRLNLEGMAAEESVKNVENQDIEKLEALQEELNRALDDKQYARVLEQNKVFHFTVYGCSGMPRLVNIIESLWLQIGPSLNRLYPEFALTRKGVSNHQWILRGLKDRDGATVRAGIENDLRDGHRRLTKMINDQSPTA